MLEEDARKLREYYQSQGFFEVKVTPVTRPGTSLGDINLTFVISEGTRYKVRNLVFEGNAKIKTKELREGLQLHSGKPFLDAVARGRPARLMMARYNAHRLHRHPDQLRAEVHQPARRGRPGLQDRGGRAVPDGRAQDRRATRGPRTRSSAARP